MHENWYQKTRGGLSRSIRRWYDWHCDCRFTFLGGSSFQSTDLSELPKNRYGDKEFLVKAQNTLDMAEAQAAQVFGAPMGDDIKFRQPISLYDEAR